MKISTKYLSIVGILLFAVIISNADISKIFTIISGVNLGMIALGLAIVPVTILFKAIRWKKIIYTVGSNTP